MKYLRPLLTIPVLLFTLAPAVAQTSGTLEMVLAPFRGGHASATTVREYFGEWWLCARGSGRAAGEQRSDSLFVFTDGLGNVLPPPGVLGINMPHPWHVALTCDWTLCINQQSPEGFVVPGSVPTIPSSTVPIYNPAHVYAFPITAPGGRLTFGVGDGYVADNSGAYVVTVGTRQEALRCYRSDFLVRTAVYYIDGAITLPTNDLYTGLGNATTYLSEGQDDLASSQLAATLTLIQIETGHGIPENVSAELTVGIRYLLGLLQNGAAKK